MATTNNIDVSLSASLGNLGQQLNQAQQLVQNTTNHIQNTVQNTQFNFNFTNIQQNLNQISTTAERTFNGIGANLSSILAQSFAVGGLVAYTKEVVHAGGEVSKFAKLVGSSTDQLQAYAAGAQTVGISLEKFADINKDVLDRFGEARRGEGEMMDFFNKIAPKVGITIEQFKGLSGPEALQLYYKGLEKANLSHAEIVTYMEQIANDASLLAPLLEKNGAGFKEWGDKAKAANAVMSQDMVASLNVAQSSLYELNLKWKGLQNTLVSSVAPSLAKLAQNFDNLKGVVAAVAAVIGVQLAMRLGALAVEFIRSVAQAVALQVQLLALQGQATSTAVAMGVLQAASSALGGPVGLAMLALQGVAAAGAFLYMKKASDTTTPALESQKKSVTELRQEYDKLDESQRRTAVRDATAQHEKAAQAYSFQREKLTELVGSMQLSTLATEEEKNKITALYTEYKLGRITSEQLANGINKLKSAHNDFKISIDQQVASVKNEAIAVSETERVLKAYGVTVQSNIELNNELAKSHDKVAEKTAQESYEQERLKGIREKVAPSILKNDYIFKNTKILGGDKAASEKATAMADFQEQNNIPLSQVMTPAIRKVFEETYAAQKKLKDLGEDITKAEKSKTQELEKQNALRVNADKTTRNMLMVYQSFMNTGVLTDKQARYFTAEVGRENDFQNKGLYGSHTDVNNGQKNIGMISWQKDRAVNLEKYLSAEGLIDSTGKIKQGQEALDAQARFLLNEISNKQAYSKSKLMLSKTSDYGSLSKTIGKNTIGWDYDGKKINAQPHHQKRDKYYNQLNSVLGDDPNKVTAVTSSFIKLEQDQTKIKDQEEKKKLELKIKYASEEIKIQTELNKALDDIDKSKLSDTEKAAYRTQAEKEANDKIIAFRTEQFDKTKIISEAEIEYNLRQAQRLYDVEKAKLQAQLDAKKITNVDKVRLEKQLEDQLYEIKRDALLKQLELENQRTDISGKTGNQTQLLGDVSDLDGKKQESDMQSPVTLKNAELSDFEQRFGGFTSRISSLWDRGIEAMLNGTLTWKSATKAVLTDMSSFFIQKMVSEPLKEYLAGQMRQLMIRLGFIKTTTAAETVGQTMQTGAHIAGEATKTAATGVGVTARTGMKATEAIQGILMSAWEAMAGAFKAMVSIPYIGPILAVGAGAAAFSLVSGIAGKIKSARGGYDIPSGVNPVTQLHEEEMVLPKQHANTIRALGKAGSSASAPSNSNSDSTGGGDMHLHVHALDAKGVKRFMKENGRSVASGLKNYKRGFGA